jgi:hypothetical protein
VLAEMGWAESDFSGFAAAGLTIASPESKCAAPVALWSLMLPTRQPDAYR